MKYTKNNPALGITTELANSIAFAQPGAARQLLYQIYTIVTRKKVQVPGATLGEDEAQVVPNFAQPTASTEIGLRLKSPELQGLACVRV